VEFELDIRKVHGFYDEWSEGKSTLVNIFLIIQITHLAPGQQISGFNHCRRWPQPWRSTDPMAHPITNRAVTWP
jgi:hypothetical protein